MSRQVSWQVMEQGKEGTTPERMRVVTDENDREEGKAVSRGASRRMSTSGRTRASRKWQEQPRESED